MAAHGKELLAQRVGLVPLRAPQIIPDGGRSRAVVRAGARRPVDVPGGLVREDEVDGGPLGVEDRGGVVEYVAVSAGGAPCEHIRGDDRLQWPP